MRIDSPKDLGLYIRDRRVAQGRTQAELAKAAAVSRRWLSALEAGKETAHFGLILRTLDALGLVVIVQKLETGPDDIDLDQYLKRFELEQGEDAS